MPLPTHFTYLPSIFPWLNFYLLTKLLYIFGLNPLSLGYYYFFKNLNLYFLAKPFYLFEKHLYFLAKSLHLFGHISIFWQNLFFFWQNHYVFWPNLAKPLSYLFLAKFLFSSKIFIFFWLHIHLNKTFIHFEPVI